MHFLVVGYYFLDLYCSHFGELYISLLYGVKSDTKQELFEKKKTRIRVCRQINSKFENYGINKITECL